MKRKKSCSESESDDGRERKSKKVMPKSLAVEIDAEAEADGAAGLQYSNPKSALAQTNIREIDLERALYRWYERYQQQRREVSQSYAALTVEDLSKKAKNLVQRLGGSVSLSNQISICWIVRWQERYGVPKIDVPDSSIKPEVEQKTYLEPIKQRLKKKGLKKNEENEVSSSMDPKEKVDDKKSKILTTDTGQEPEGYLQSSESAQTFRNECTKDVRPIFQEYDSDQVYFAFCFELDWKSLPDKTLECRNEEPVWLLMAGNRSGRHRTRILVTGRHWRPNCLKHVNMLSQPVVYAGGGKGMMTQDLFAWWFHREFVPAAESLHSEAVLIVEDKWSTEKIQGTRNVKLVTISRGEILDWNMILAEFRARYATLLLRKLSSTETTSVTEYLNDFTLKEAFPLFHKSWLIIRPESFQRFSDLQLDSKEDKSSESISASLIQSTLMGTGKSEELKEERRSRSRKPEVLSLTRRGTTTHEDRMLLLELQWLAHDIGLEVTDDDISCWASDSKVLKVESVKVEDTKSSSEGGNVPNASEAAEHMSRALLWLETQAIDPNLLLVVRDVIDVAKQASKMGLAPPHPGAALPFFCHNGDHLTQPPPAHMGIPPYQLDAKGAGAMGEYWRGLGLGGLSIRPPASGPPGSPVPPHPAISPQDWKRLGPLLAASGLSRTPMYPFPAGSTYPYPMLSPEMSQVAASWHTPGMYPISAGAGFRSPYPSSLPISTTLPSDFYRFSPTGLLPGHPGLSPHGHHSLSSHPAIVTPGPKQELVHHTQSDHNHRIRKSGPNGNAAATGNVDEEKVTEENGRRPSLTQNMEQWCPSPLNLVKKTKPVAIVAPSSKVTKDDSDSEAKVERQDGVEDARTKLTHTTKYHIERLLEKDESTEREATGCSNNFYNMVSDLSSTEQQVLAAIYMRDLMTNFSQNPYLRYGSYIPPPFFGAYENYRRFLMESRSDTIATASDKNKAEEPPKTDPYPFLRERLNSRPVNEAEAEEEEADEEENGSAKEKPDYEKGIDLFQNVAKTEDGLYTEQDMDEPLNLRVNNNNEEPLDFSRKSKGFVLSPNPSVSLTLNLKSPEFESLSKPLVLTIPNPQERTPKMKKKEKCSRSKRSSSLDHKNSSSSHHNAQDSKNHDSGSQNDKKKPHIKKPLNAFMLYMKEMRAKVVAECTLKESAAINQILGRRWHSLTRDEQAKYYEKARHERQLHMQLYPGWSARDNYGYGTKKKKRKKERTPEITSLGGSQKATPMTSHIAITKYFLGTLEGVLPAWHALGREEQAKYYELARRERQLHMQLYPDWSSRANSSRGKKRKRKQEANDGGNNMKKCRARYGLDQQSQWCKPCRRKKKCIRYLESGEERDGNQSEDNLGSCGSVGEAKTPPDDDDGVESLPHSLSSPGGLSGLSSLTSPSMILPSPSTSLTSPSVSLASPCMSLQSPLTPPTFDMKPIMPIALPPLNRNPVGTNPHDVNNPLSVNQLTGKCIKSEPKEQSRPISVT